MRIWPIGDKYVGKKNYCKGCGYIITWAGMKEQFKRILMRTNKEIAKLRSGFCQKCNTSFLKKQIG